MISSVSYNSYQCLVALTFSVLSEVSVCPYSEAAIRGLELYPSMIFYSPFIGGSRISYSGEFVPPD